MTMLPLSHPLLLLQLESEIHTMEDGMEQRAATLEARRLLAERNAASQQAEAVRRG